ncbi:MAG: GNAT family N-acetyltransferase [Rhodobacteraceae bacterium]|nr:GNAT family N-acetyltransferase [Paracoccaceae bacterium]
MSRPSAPHAYHTRIAAAVDVPGIVRLLSQLTSENPTDETIAQSRLEALALWPGSGVWIALEGDAVVSTCTLIVAPNLSRHGAPWALIENVVTDSDHRGKGYGRAVIKSAVDSAFGLGCFKVMLATGSTDPETHRFYEGCGFAQTKLAYEIRRLPKRPD